MESFGISHIINQQEILHHFCLQEELATLQKETNKESTFSFPLFPRKAFIVSFSIQIRQMKFLRYVSLHRVSHSFLRYYILQYVSVHQLGPKLRPSPCKHTVHTRFTKDKIIFYILYCTFFSSTTHTSTQLEIAAKGTKFRQKASR